MASGSQGLPLIKSKIRVPRRQPTLLRRERLVNYLHENIDHKLILVSAGAGYGKTSLLIDYSHDTELPVCWYSLDRNDCHIFTFIEYLVAAIRERFAGFGESVLQAMRTFDGPDEAVEPFVRLLVNEIEERVDDYFVLVLDDFHHVTDSATVNALLDGLLLWLPEHCHIILASRGIPRRITLTRLASTNQVEGLGVDLLAFTGEEIHDLLHALGHNQVDQAQAQALADRSEGWITGVLLAAQANMGAVEEQVLTSSLASGGVFDFMAAEILERQPQPIQDFMLGSALLREMSPPLCDALLGIDNSAQILHDLAQDSLFISAIDAAAAWYQYHQLFREFLLARLEALTPDRYHSLCVAHADLMVNQGHWPEAIAAYLDAQAHAEAADAIEIIAADMFDAGSRSRMGDWVDALPEPVQGAHPRLLVFRGRIAAEMGEPVEALGYLERAQGIYEAQGDEIGTAQALVHTAFPQRVRGRLQDAIEACHAVLEMLGDKDSHTAMLARSQASICYCMQGQFDHGLREMSLALDIAHKAGDDVGAAYAVTDMGNIEVNRGNLRNAQKHFHQALLYWRKIGNQATLSSTLQGLGLVHQHLGQYIDAENRFSQALDNAQAVQDVRLEAYGLANMGDLLRDMGRYSEAIEAYDQGIAKAFASQTNYLILYMQATKGDALALRAGQSRSGPDSDLPPPEQDLHDAQRLLLETRDQIDPARMQQEAGLTSLALAQVALAQIDMDKAQEHAVKALNALSETGYVRDIARAHLMAALVAERRQTHPLAIEHLEQVGRLAQQLGTHQFIVAQGAAVYQLLDVLDAHPVEGLDATILRAELETLFPTTALQSNIQMVSRSVPIELLALNGGQVLHFGQIVTAWEADAARLLAFLLAANPQGLDRDQVTEMLWPEVSPARGSSRCYSTFHRLRSALAKEIISRRSGVYCLNPDSDYRYDVSEFEGLAALSQGDDGSAHLARRQAISLYRSDYLETCDLAWCDELRQALQVKMTGLLQQEAAYLARHHQLDEALSLYARFRVMDPFDERAHRGIIWCRGQLNDQAGVARQWQECQRLFADELGVEPSPETEALYQMILNGTKPPLPD